MFLKEISIIVATKNRPVILYLTLKKAIEAIGSLPVELIVVNDGDTVLDFPQAFCSLKFLSNPSRGVASARNYGVAKSNGRILFFMDDDMWINKLGLEWILEKFSVAGNEKSVFNINWEYPIELQKKLFNTKIGRYILSSNYNTMWGRMHVHGDQPSFGTYKFSRIASGSLVMSRDTFDFIGGYNESFVFAGEDVELSNRINRNGIDIFCVFDVTFFHNHSDRLDFDGYLERENRGFHSQFTGEIMGLMPRVPNNYLGLTGVLFRILQLNEIFLIWVIKLLPNHSFLSKLTNRLIGLLSSLQGFKQWRKVYEKL